jgi:hypothetical protein
LAPTALAGGSFARPFFSLGGSLGFSLLLFGYDVLLQLSQNSWGQLA